MAGDHGHDSRHSKPGQVLNLDSCIPGQGQPDATADNKPTVAVGCQMVPVFISLRHRTRIRLERSHVRRFCRRRHLTVPFEASSSASLCRILVKMMFPVQDLLATLAFFQGSLDIPAVATSPHEETIKPSGAHFVQLSFAEPKK